MLIYPTGRAENGSFVLQGPDGYFVTVTLRGLTGAVSIGPLEHRARPVEQGGGDESSSRAPEDDVVESLGDRGGFE